MDKHGIPVVHHLLLVLIGFISGSSVIRSVSAGISSSADSFTVISFTAMGPSPPFSKVSRSCDVVTVSKKIFFFIGRLLQSAVAACTHSLPFQYSTVMPDSFPSVSGLLLLLRYLPLLRRKSQRNLSRTVLGFPHSL